MSLAPSAAAVKSALALLGIAVCVTARAAAPEVGTVSLLIGEARVVRMDGTREALHRGASIRIGDRLETAANGHVHVRFIDNAAVSVRPESVLEIQAYRYDASNPQANEIRLKLEQGASRSISGAATEIDKSRFRLNTPIAAIGVRGTDFIVQADPAGVRATVSDGAIVVGALGGACSATGLGPCQGAEARELTAAMGRWTAEVRPGDRVARIVPTPENLIAAAGASAERMSPSRMASAAAVRQMGLSAAEPTPAELAHANDRAAADLLAVAAIGARDLQNQNRPTEQRVNFNVPSKEDGQLIWGRWSFVPAAGDKLSVQFSQAQWAPFARHITVANEALDAYLFRANQTVPGQFFSDSLQATVDFRLTNANATYDIGTSKEAARFDLATLQIDFARRTFVTALDLSTESGVEGKLRVGGVMRNDGIFVQTDVGQYVAGAVSLDGKEAGYLFERNVGSGLFRGKTLWLNK